MASTNELGFANPCGYEVYGIEGELIESFTCWHAHKCRSSASVCVPKMGFKLAQALKEGSKITVEKPAIRQVLEEKGTTRVISSNFELKPMSIEDTLEDIIIMGQDISSATKCK